MANVKDEGKKMDPLFPRLHISDTDKRGPKTPPWNKMALSQQFNVPSQRCISGSLSSVIPSQSSSHRDSSYKRSVFSTFGRSCGSSRTATRLDSYQSSGINLNISLTTVKQTIETTNCQTVCNVGQLKRDDYSLFTPQNLTSTKNSSKKFEDEDDYLLPSLSFGNDQHNIKHPVACQKQLKLIDNDTTQENDLNSTAIKDNTKEPMPYYSDKVRFSEMLSDPSKRSMSIDEPHISQDPNIRLLLKRKSLQENMSTYKSEENHGSLLDDNFKIDGDTHEVRAHFNKSEEDRGSLHLEYDGKMDDNLERNFLSRYNITPEQVSQVIGHEQFCIARRTIIQQQRVFQSQLFELHRLIKVQTLLAESHHLLLEDNFPKLKKIHSEDSFVHVSHHKKESNISFPIDHTLRKPIYTNNETDIRYSPNLIDLPPPPPTINGSKQGPCCFLPPPPLGNQWLVPVRSPSEGLVYKPYTGPSLPPVGLMTPVYGMSLTPSTNDFLTTSYNIPTSYNQQGLSLYPSTPLFTSYGLPTITNPSCSSNEADVKHSKTMKTTCNLLTQEIKQSDDDLHGIHERKKGDELQLFPTTPMVKDSDQEKGYDEKIKVIKVVPHNPKLASESAARIFKFIHEERKHDE